MIRYFYMTDMGVARYVRAKWSKHKQISQISRRMEAKAAKSRPITNHQLQQVKYQMEGMPEAS